MKENIIIITSGTSHLGMMWGLGHDPRNLNDSPLKPWYSKYFAAISISCLVGLKALSDSGIIGTCNRGWRRSTGFVNKSGAEFTSSTRFKHDRVRCICLLFDHDIGDNGTEFLPVCFSICLAVMDTTDAIFWLNLSISQHVTRWFLMCINFCVKSEIYTKYYEFLLPLWIRWKKNYLNVF